MKNTILRKTLTVTLLAIVLSAVLTALTFNYYGRTVFSEIKAREMAPRAEFIAELTSEYLQGRINLDAYGMAMGSGYHIWDASVYVYNGAGELFAYPSQEGALRNGQILENSVADVLAGNALYSPNTRNDQGVIIGQPVYGASDNVIGAVFLIKPLREVSTAINSLLKSLVVTMVAVTAIMVLPVYISSKNILQPIRKMQTIANAMARGNFAVRAPEEGGDEIASLGRSLNYLSAALAATIGDLTFEKNRLTATLNGLGEGIASFGQKEEVLQQNPAALSLLGLKPEDSVKDSPLWPQLEPLLQETLAGREAAPVSMERGEAILLFTMAPLQEGGRTEGAVMLIQDITESARLEKTRTDYVANVSHELRTPLASIRGLADALNDGLVKKETDKARYYGYILHESMRLSRLIDDLLELSRLQSGAVALSKQSAHIDDLVYDVADRYGASAKERGLELRLSLPQDCPRAYTNPDRAEQVLIALLDNAIKHGESEGVISIDVLDQGDKLEIRVSNPGEIGEKDLPHLFERFYKVDQSHSGGGTGLGLSIAYEIMCLMGETIWAESRDGRVTFAFTLAKAPGKELEKAGKNV